MLRAIRLCVFSFPFLPDSFPCPCIQRNFCDTVKDCINFRLVLFPVKTIVVCNCNPCIADGKAFHNVRILFTAIYWHDTISLRLILCRYNLSVACGLCALFLGCFAVLNASDIRKRLYKSTVGQSI
nr:MAG TPA: hypothetical protein [Caudoviricetes sp.]